MNYSTRTKGLIIASARAMSNHPEWRWGQAVYNTAWPRYPDIVRVMPDYVNPFNSDRSVDTFLRWLEYKMGENNE